MKKKDINYKLNFIKGIGCLSVIFIHVRFPGIFGTCISKMAGFAVPNFLMISGYYAYEKDPEVIKKRLKKIILLFLYAYILFFTLKIFGNNDSLGMWLCSNFNWQTPIKYIVFCTIDFAIPLWYLIAMIEIYIYYGIS